MLILIYFIGSLLALDFDITNWWVIKTIIGKIFFGLLLGILSYGLYISSNDDNVKKKVDSTPLTGFILLFIMEIMFIIISQHVIINYFIK